MYKQPARGNHDLTTHMQLCAGESLLVCQFDKNYGMNAPGLHGRVAARGSRGIDQQLFQFFLQTSQVCS